jgi:hypothetical protein
VNADHLHRIQLATAVLLAISNHCAPSSSDADALRALAESPKEREMPLDELACEIIMREIERNGRQVQRI